MKYILLIFSLFLLMSCDDSKTNTRSPLSKFNIKNPLATTGNNLATPGTGVSVASAPIFTKSCTEGSIKVFQAGGTTVQSLTYNTVSELKAGDKIRITGVVNKTSCPLRQPVSFSCDGVVTVGTNRILSCSTGTLSSFVSRPPATRSPNFGSPTTTQQRPPITRSPNFGSPTTTQQRPPITRSFDLGPITSQPGAPITRSPYSTSSTAQSFSQGNFLVYDNGFKFFAEFKVLTDIGYCPVSFLCD